VETDKMLMIEMFWSRWWITMHHCYFHLSPSAPCLLSLFLIATRDIVNKALGDIAKIKISTSSSNQLPMMLLVGVKLDFKMTSSFDGWSA
jgi:hypothetical protein